MTTRGLAEQFRFTADPILIAAPILLLASAYFASAWPEDHLVLEIIEALGVPVLLFAVLGRCWSILAAQASSNDVPSIQGPYRFVAHPMYFFGSLAFAAIGMIAGSSVLAIVFFLFGFVMSRILINRRDEHPLYNHSEAAMYRELVPDFFPSLSPRVTADEATDRLVYSQSMLMRCVLDAGFLLMLYPLAEGIDTLRESGMLAGHLAIY